MRLDICNFSPLLMEMYERLHKNPEDQLKDMRMFHSDIHYIRYHINDLFDTDYTNEEILELLVDEGLIARSEIRKYVRGTTKDDEE